MKINEKLLVVRKKLGLSKTQMADGVIDPSYYSRVERGESSISNNDLFLLLKKYHISIVDFMSDFGDDLPEIEIYQDQILKAFREKDIKKLEEIKSDPAMNYLLLKRIVDGMLKSLNSGGKKEELPAELKLYFSNIDYWADYDLWNLWICLQVYVPTHLQSLAEIVVLQFFRRDYKEQNYTSLELAANIAMVNLKLSYKAGEIGVAKTMISLLEKLPAANCTLFPKLIGKYYEAIYDNDNAIVDNIKDTLDIV